MNDLLPTLEKWAPLFQIMTGLATVLVLFLTLKTSHRLKGTDVRMEQQRKFDLMLEAKHALKQKGKTEEDVQWYCYRFWNLQADEFHEWREGMLSNSLFRSWMETRQNDWDSNSELGAGMRYQDGWNKVKDKFTNVGFRDFMEMVVSHRHGIDMAFKKYRPNRINRLTARLLK
jgi:hypothetical protein